MSNPEHVTIAKEWVGTPYVHHHAEKGRACDCRGLITGVGQEAGVLVVDPAKWAPFEGYSAQPRPRTVLHFAMTFLVRVRRAPVLGDLVLIAWRPGLAMHFAIVSEHKGRPTLIHALEKFGKVVEHGFVAEWPGLVHSVWTFPGAR